MSLNDASEFWTKRKAKEELTRFLASRAQKLRDDSPLGTRELIPGDPIWTKLPFGQVFAQYEIRRRSVSKHKGDTDNTKYIDVYSEIVADLQLQEKDERYEFVPMEKQLAGPIYRRVWECKARYNSKGLMEQQDAAVRQLVYYCRRVQDQGVLDEGRLSNGEWQREICRRVRGYLVIPKGVGFDPDLLRTEESKNLDLRVIHCNLTRPQLERWYERELPRVF